MTLLRGGHRPYTHLGAEDEAFPDPDDLQVDLRVNDGHCRPHKLTAVCAVGLATILVMVVVACITTIPGVLTDASGNSLFSRIFSSASSPTEKIGPNDVIVKTSCGEFIGSVEDGAYVFKGIPYARPPVGHLRWKKPVPSWGDKSWCKTVGRKRVQHFGPACFQQNPYTKQYEGKEDCLYLNVWSPTLDILAGLEVLVWIHGGFLQFGSGHQPGLSPSGLLARRLNVVFVSMNYRLYTIGFMALDTLVENTNVDTLGNYGIWDQVVALQWVKDHIKSFGGNPEKVTVFGADAGAASIVTMLAAPITQGLFRSAWLVGPAVVLNHTYGELSKYNRAFFQQRSGCKDANCLRKMPSKEVIGTFLGKDDPSFRIRDQTDLPIQGIYSEQMISVDGDILSTTPTEAFQGGQGNDLPVLVGTAAQAVDFWPGPDNLESWTWNQYKKYVTTSLDSFGPRVSKLAVQLYNASLFTGMSVTPELMYTTMVSDVRQTCPINDLTEDMAKTFLSPVYRYIVTSRPSQPVHLFDYDATYSFHLWDVVAFFQHLELFMRRPNEQDQAFVDLIQDMVLRFVRSGGKDVGFSDWMRYPKNLVLISENFTAVDDYHKTGCKFWTSNGMNAYAWVS